MKTLQKRKKFAELGRKGGESTAQKYGSDHMREIGLRGLEKRYKKKLRKAPAGRRAPDNKPKEKTNA